MNRASRLALELLCCLAVLAPAAPVRAQQWAAYFSPHGGCIEAIVTALNQARTSLHVQAYSFTSYPITKALIEAQARGVGVEVILDQNRLKEKGSRLDSLLAAGVPA